MKYKILMGMNLQFFADGDGSGADGGNGSGDGAGTGAGTGTGGGGDVGEGGNGGNEPPSFDDVLKTGHQAEFDRRVQKAIETALGKQRDKYETLMNDKLTEAEKMAKMTKEEKAEYQRQQAEKSLSDREAAVTRKELMAEAKNTLAEKKLPVSLAEVLNYTDADSCKKSIEAIETAFTQAVESAVEDKLKGGNPPKKNEGGTTYTMEQIKNMSADEINKNWEAVSQAMKNSK